MRTIANAYSNSLVVEQLTVMATNPLQNITLGKYNKQNEDYLNPTRKPDENTKSTKNVEVTLLQFVFIRITTN